MRDCRFEMLLNECVSVGQQRHTGIAKPIFSNSLLLNDFIRISVLIFKLPACCHTASLSKSKQSVKKSFKLTFSSQFKSM